MIIVRTPLRLSVAGGGCDLPSFYTKYGAMFISAAIDKYIYTTVHSSKYGDTIRLRYSQMEEIQDINEIKHDIFRETLRINCPNSIEITSHAEIPSGTGLGSSGSFGVSVLHALNPKIAKEPLAAEATRIQMEILKYPIGKQDQYVATYGGIQMYQIDCDGEVSVQDFLTDQIKKLLEEKLVLFYTGIKRDTNQILKNSTNQDLDLIQKIGWDMKNALGQGDIDAYGRMLDEHWQFKKNRGQMTTPEIDEWYTLARRNDALGGKIVGAGGGGFLMFYTNDSEKLINVMPLQHQPFRFDMEGSKVIYENIS